MKQQETTSRPTEASSHVTEELAQKDQAARTGQDGFENTANTPTEQAEAARSSDSANRTGTHMSEEAKNQQETGRRSRADSGTTAPSRL